MGKEGAMSTPEFKEFAKIARLSRQVIITEKIDGTNACLFVPEDPALPLVPGSRNRWVPVGEDHFGFVKWATEHEGELRTLGPGVHYGEWWGSGVGRRGYGLPQGEKRWSLFNVSRWEGDRPACCQVVPVVARGLFTTDLVEQAIAHLREHGSLAVQGFMRPEGVVIYHAQGNVLFKKTLENDEVPKGSRETP
jgi:RNA ligase